MGRTPCCPKVGLLRGPWTPREDALLINYVKEHGEGQWRSLPKKAGLLRCGKSCRLRWMNYLRPGIKRGGIGQDEEELILKLHALLGNRWSLIAGRLPGRTDNEIKNYWNSHLSKKLRRNGIDPTTHKPMLRSLFQHSDDDGKNGRKKQVGGLSGSKLHMPKAVRVISEVPPPWMRGESKVRQERNNNGSRNGGEFTDGGGPDEPRRTSSGVSLLDQNIELPRQSVHGSEIFQLWHDSGNSSTARDGRSTKMKAHEPSVFTMEDGDMLLDSFIQSLMD
ncbi:unnamed protein product [Victoria cruziana]